MPLETLLFLVFKNINRRGRGGTQRTKSENAIDSSSVILRALGDDHACFFATEFTEKRIKKDDRPSSKLSSFVFNLLSLVPLSSSSAFLRALCGQKIFFH
jgi:hypothetical protein